MIPQLLTRYKSTRDAMQHLIEGTPEDDAVKAAFHQVQAQIIATEPQSPADIKALSEFGIILAQDGWDGEGLLPVLQNMGRALA